MGLLISLESIFGWVYFVAWSATFWPQVLLIYKRKVTSGLSTDFVAINIVGFISYAIFTFCSYYLPSVSSAYITHTGYPPQVELNDVLFAAHGAIMCTVLVLQLLLLPPRIPPKPYVSVGVIIVQTSVLLGLAACLLNRFDWFDFLRYSGMVKVFASLIKHFPQVFLNRQRNSTVGWSFTMVLLDIIGGFFSVMQQVVKCMRINSWAPFTSNYAKTFLAAESLAFDFWFIAQHLLWYTDRTDPDLGLAKPRYHDRHDDPEELRLVEQNIA